MSDPKRRLVHNHGSTQYELLIDDVRAGYLDYELSGDLVVMHTTFVSDDFKGRGLGGEIVQAALSDVRGQGRKVVAQCSFVRDFIEKNPEYRDLLAG